MLHTLSASGNTLYAVLEVAYKGLLQLCVVINPIILIFFLIFGMVLSKYGLDYLFYGIFSIDWILLLIFRNVILGSFWVMGLGCYPSHARIIYFRLAPASASLRLIRSLRIYYSMLCEF